MATTHAKPGFRLPWGGDRAADVPAPGAGDGTPADAAPDVPGMDTAAVAQGPASQESESHPMIDAPSTPLTEAAVDRDASPAPVDRPESATHARPVAPLPTQPSTSRKPNKFLADLTKAMQAAAESAKADTLERLAADAKTMVQTIHEGSATEATELRKRADDDVAAVREWSKSEIARIREETDARIAQRKQRLEHEIEAHAARVEARIDRVQQRVAAFEAEMQGFFERLLEEQDPTRFASLAEALPEPPPLDGDEVPQPAAPVGPPDASTASAAQERLAPAVEGAPVGLELAPDDAVAAASSFEDARASEAASTSATTPASAPMDAPARGRDPRLAMLGLDRDFAAAEAEALAYTPDDATSEEPVPEPGDDLIAARLAGIVSHPDAAPAETVRTRLVVVGLVSVASIAGFKRHLSRVPGVSHVGVTSGPEGEFIFTATHDPSAVLREVIPTLPGFAARITGDVDGDLAVTARDPETEH